MCSRPEANKMQPFGVMQQPGMGFDKYCGLSSFEHGTEDEDEKRRGGWMTVPATTAFVTPFSIDYIQ